LKNLSVLAMQSKPQNYVALIYMDLDRLGKYLRDHGSRSKQHYRQLSRRTRSAVHHGVICGCAVISQSRDEPAPTPPFEIMLIGGDDAILFVAAHEAGAFLGSFAESYRESIVSLPDAGSALSFSAGIVWAHRAHHHFPSRNFAREPKNWCVRPRGIGVQYWTLCSRLKPEHRLLFDGVFGPPGGSSVPPAFRNGPWEGRPARSTRAADLVELWDFIPEDVS
jgi:hypothetical protein